MENGKIAIMEGLKNGIGLGSTEFHVIRFHSSIPRGFYFHYLTQDEFRKKAQSKMKGTAGQLRVPTNFLQQEFVPVPPLLEQRRIVSKIESIFAQIDASRQRLERLATQISSASGSLAQLKDSILKQAFEGKLVLQDPNDESAEILLKRLSRDSDKPIEFETVELPDGWINTKLRNVVENIKKNNPKDMPNKLFYYCDINSINNSQFKITAPKQFLGKDAPSRARQSIRSKDILFSTVRTYLKNIAIVPSFLDGHLASTGFCILRPKQDIDNTYIFNYVQSEKFLLPLNLKQRGTSYPAVRDSDVLNNMISLPPFREQRRIVSKIESIFARIDAHITHVLFA